MIKNGCGESKNSNTQAFEFIGSGLIFFIKGEHMKKITIQFVCFFLLLTIPSFSTNYYVDKDANGSNNGTSWTNAWESFASINWNSINPGDIIWISGGTSGKTYFEKLSVNATIKEIVNNPAPLLFITSSIG